MQIKVFLLIMILPFLGLSQSKYYRPSPSQAAAAARAYEDIPSQVRITPDIEVSIQSDCEVLVYVTQPRVASIKFGVKVKGSGKSVVYKAELLYPNMIKKVILDVSLSRGDTVEVWAIGFRGNYVINQ